MDTNDELKEYTELKNAIKKNHKLYNDQELSDKIFELYSIIPRKNPIGELIHDFTINEILEKRVEKYCNRNNIQKFEYDGCLPIRYYKIPFNKLSIKESEKKLKELMKIYNEDINFIPKK